MLIIFDCDGVLRSFSWEAVYESYQAIAKHLGREPQDFWCNYDDFMQWVDFIEWNRNLQRMGVPLGSDYSEIRSIFHGVYDQRIGIFHWAPEILDELAGRHELAVLSSSTAYSLNNSLEFLSEYFSHIIASDHVTNIKPDPEGINLIMNEVGAKPSETLMIGDAWVDIMAGKNAGVKTAGVSWGMTNTKDLLKYNPDFISEDPQRLRLI